MRHHPLRTFRRSVCQTCDRPATRLDHKNCQLSGSSPIYLIIGIDSSSMKLLLAKSCIWSVANFSDVLTMMSTSLYPKINKGQKPTKIDECLSPALMKPGISKKSQIRSNFGDTGAWSLAVLIARYKK